MTPDLSIPLCDTPCSPIAAAIGSLPFGLMMWGIIGVLLIIFALYSVIMLWHWKEYSTGKYTTVANMFMYVGVACGCFAVMALAAVWYSAL